MLDPLGAFSERGTTAIAAQKEATLCADGIVHEAAAPIHHTANQPTKLFCKTHLAPPRCCAAVCTANSMCMLPPMRFNKCSLAWLPHNAVLQRREVHHAQRFFY